MQIQINETTQLIPVGVEEPSEIELNEKADQLVKGTDLDEVSIEIEELRMSSKQAKGIILKNLIDTWTSFLSDLLSDLRIS